MARGYFEAFVYQCRCDRSPAHLVIPLHPNTCGCHSRLALGRPVYRCYLPTPVYPSTGQPYIVVNNNDFNQHTHLYHHRRPQHLPHPVTTNRKSLMDRNQSQTSPVTMGYMPPATAGRHRMTANDQQLIRRVILRPLSRPSSPDRRQLHQLLLRDPTALIRVRMHRLWSNQLPSHWTLDSAVDAALLPRLFSSIAATDSGVSHLLSPASPTAVTDFDQPSEATGRPTRNVKQLRLKIALSGNDVFHAESADRPTRPALMSANDGGEEYFGDDEADDEQFDSRLSQLRVPRDHKVSISGESGYETGSPSTRPFSPDADRLSPIFRLIDRLTILPLDTSHNVVPMKTISQDRPDGRACDDRSQISSARRHFVNGQTGRQEGEEQPFSCNSRSHDIPDNLYQRPLFPSAAPSPLAAPTPSTLPSSSLPSAGFLGFLCNRFSATRAWIGRQIPRMFDWMWQSAFISAQNV